jgi:hypothetical protein
VTANALVAIVALPDRDDVEVFCAHDTVTELDPLPLVGDTVSQDPLPPVVQVPPVQPDGAPVIVTVCDPAADVGFADSGEIEKLVQAGGAAPPCVTANVLLAIVALADRAKVDALAVQNTVTDPDPLPLAGDTVSHDPFPAAVQLPPVQPAGDPVIVTPCDPAADVGFADSGEIEKLVQAGGAAPPWLTVKLLPAIVALPDRDDVEVFCAHDTVAELDPLPLVGDTVIQDPFPDACQLPPVQPDGAPVIVTLCDPAAGVGFADSGEIEKLVQAGGTAPPCVTANVLLAIVALPDRDDVEVFCAQDTAAVPDPLPLAGHTVSQDPLPPVVQLPPVQPAGDPVIVTPCDPAVELGLADVGAIAKLVQVGASLTTTSSTYHPSPDRVSLEMT